MRGLISHLLLEPGSDIAGLGVVLLVSSELNEALSDQSTNSITEISPVRAGSAAMGLGESIRAPAASAAGCPRGATSSCLLAPLSFLPKLFIFCR